MYRPVDLDSRKIYTRADLIYMYIYVLTGACARVHMYMTCRDRRIYIYIYMYVYTCRFYLGTVLKPDEHGIGLRKSKPWSKITAGTSIVISYMLKSRCRIFLYVFFIF